MRGGKRVIIVPRMRVGATAWKWIGIAAVVVANAYLLGEMGMLGNPVPEPVAAPVAPPWETGDLLAPGDTSDEAFETTVVAELTDHPDDEEPPAKPKRRPDAPADLVVLLSVDGLRPDAVYPGAPTIHRLGVEGARAPHSRTISKASTLPSHASMVSGVDMDQHGLSFNAYRPERGHIQYPTIFTGAQRAGLPTALFVGKKKLRHLLNPDTVAHFEVGGVFCSKVTDLAVPYLARAKQGLVFIHFSDPDSAGHRHGWMSPEYAKAVRRADRCVRDIVDVLKERGKLERTALLVTSDHGGHDHNHGTRRMDDRQIPWVLWGGPVSPGKKVRREVMTTDTAATIFHLLGIEPSAEIIGRPVLRALKQAKHAPLPGPEAG